MKARLLVLFILIFMVFTSPLLSQQGLNERNRFYDINELTKLIEKAREAGYSQEELENLTLVDGDQVINVMEYIDSIRRRKELKDKALKEFLSKKFLTVKDIYAELIKLEPEVLDQLREELVSDR